jgi:ABC-type nitrate/sulfonate/bicarbonate transport system ATPase subunit
MRQRAAIARALVVEPDILVMDEPFSSLDPQTRLELEDEILKIRKRTGTTILMVTHSPEDAVYLADRIIVLTRRPARVKEEVPVPFPYPRDISDPAFISLRLTVNRLLSS